MKTGEERRSWRRPGPGRRKRTSEKAPTGIGAGERPGGCGEYQGNGIVTEKRRIVVIGLDGATWDLLRPRMNDGRLPNLARLARSGATGDLESIYPPETPAAWPSFMTGKNPGKHGVFDFLVYDPESKTERPVNAGLRVGKTLWEYLSDAGKTSLVLNVPPTYPPASIRGAMVTDFLTPADAQDYTHPRELAAEFERDYGKYPLFFETLQFVPS